MRNKILAILILFVFKSITMAATGCSLNDPDRDIMRIFPQSTGYRTEFIRIDERGGDALIKEIEQKLKDSVDPTYEASDVPYAYYVVLKGKEEIGRVHGLNQKGMFGGMQLIVATDLNGKIIQFYYQKLSSPEAKKFRNKTFTKQFVGLSLTDFYQFIHAKSGKLAEIKSPSETFVEEFDNTIRGIAKNLIQLDVFYLNRQFDEEYKKNLK